MVTRVPRRVRAWLGTVSGVALVATGLGVGALPTDAVATTADKIEPAVARAVADDAKASFWIRFDDRPDLDALAAIPDWSTRGHAVHEALRSTAETSQAAARAALDAAGTTYHAYHATNAIRVAGGDADLVERMASLKGVEGIYAVRRYEEPEPVPAEPAVGPAAVEWGIADINSPQVWDTYGDGEGITVASIDTGVEWDHPALVGQYRGYDADDDTVTHDYHWFDGTGLAEPEPFDWDGHGTHVTGTMVGDDGGDNQIGVAPGARWIAASTDFSDEMTIAAGEWMLAPTAVDGTAPDPDQRPHVINNSWSSGMPSNDPFMEDVIEAWAASGQFAVFANGNEGPACETSGSPGSRIVTYSVGSYDSAHDISIFSSRGPGQDGEVKPNIAAPGDGIRSSFPGHDYLTISGTSMASPHVAGTVALLWSAGPALVGNVDLVRELLDGTAIDTEDLQCGGTPEDNNVFGEGRLDALALLDAAPLGPTGTLSGTITEAATGEPLAGATVAAVGTEMSRTVRTDADGTFALKAATGEYDVTVSLFGYVSQTAAVVVEEDQTVTLDVALDPAPMGSVRGTVTDGSGQGWPLYARVAVGNDAATFTDPQTGEYTLALPAGTHTLRVTAQLPGYPAAQREVTVVADAEGVADFALTIDQQSCLAPGYRATYDGELESFDAEELPPGWEVHDFSGGGAWTIGDPQGQPNKTGGDGLFAVVNSDAYPPDVLQDTVLVTPSYDLSGATSPVLEFKQEFDAIDAVASVEYSVDGGQEWTTAWERTSSIHGPNTTVVDLSGAAGAEDARVRFHYVTFTWDWWWQVDDVFVGERSCDPTGGGLVTGYVTDDRADDPVLGAQVVSVDNPADVGTTRATPADDALDDGFYLMYSELEGVTPFEARAARYGAVARDVDVVAGAVTRADWVLPSADVVIDPTSIETTVELGAADSGSFTVTNTGTAAAELTFAEVRGGFEMLRADGSTIGAQAAREAAGAPVVRIPVEATTGAARPAGTAPASEPAAPAPQEEPWEDLAMLPAPVMDNRMVTLDGAWYSIGGTHDGMTASDAVWRYDPVALDWAAKTPLPEAVQQPAAAAVGGGIVVAGGWVDGGAITSGTWLYDEGTDTWTSGAELPVPVSAPGQAVVDGLLYVVGGCTTDVCDPISDVVQVYDPDADSWSVLGSYPEPVAFPSCGGIDGQVVCAGGAAGTGGDSAATYALDPTLGDWTPLPDAPVAVWGAVHAAANGMLVVSGGIQDGELTNASFGFVPQTSAWEPLPASNVAAYRGGGTCGFVRAGGIDANFDISGRAEYLPGFEDCLDSGADVPWLELDTTEADLAPGESITVEVTTDSGQVNQPGTYTAGVRVRGNLPTPPEPVEVTMEVTPPATWGKLDGTGSIMTCDGVTIPIEGIVVSALPTRSDVTGGFLMTTDTSGYYARWVNDQVGELGLTATLDGFHPDSATVLPLRGRTVTTDLDLLDTACEIDPGPYPPEVERIAGADRYVTAVEVSQAFPPGVDTVFVATGQDFPDALAAAGRAGSLGGPVLLTRESRLPAVTAEELARLQPATVVVVGGTEAISADVQQRIRATVPDADVRRYAGEDRYETAALIAADVPASDVVFVATGATFPDALAGSARAGDLGAPMLLVRQDRLPAATAAQLERLAPDRIVLLGGPEAVSDAVEERLADYGTVERVHGADRFETAAAVADDLPTARDVYVATGRDFPDALAGSALAAHVSSPVLLVRPGSVPEATRETLVRLDPARVVVLGGPEAVSEEVVAELAALR